MFACGSIQGTVCNNGPQFESERMSKHVSPKTMVRMLLHLFKYLSHPYNVAVCRGCKHPEVKSRDYVKLSKVAIRDAQSVFEGPIEDEENKSGKDEAVAAGVQDKDADAKVAKSAPVMHAARRKLPPVAARPEEICLWTLKEDLKAKVATLLKSREITFYTNSSHMDDEGTEICQIISGYYVKHPAIGISIEGHSNCLSGNCGSGTSCYMEKLCLERCEKIKELFIELGCKNVIRTAGWGCKHPKYGPIRLFRIY
jgi:outer membrane protein OmpA-like peptidoglycan-associated protein